MPYKNKKKQERVKKRIIKNVQADKTEKATKQYKKYRKKIDGASAKFPEIKEKNEGKFTAWVEKNMGGMDTCKAASKIMRSRTKKYSPAVVKMANYANNFGCKTKKEDGASMGYFGHGKESDRMKEFKAKQNAKKAKLKASRSASDGASVKDPDIKAAKKQIRKGANVLGGGNIVDDFGSKHGYHSKKTSELDNSRLVQRKKRQYRKDEAKANIKNYRGKENRKGFKSDEHTKAMSDITGKKFTAKDGNKQRKQEIKDIKQTTKTRNKKSKKYAKANRIVAKAKKM